MQRSPALREAGCDAGAGRPQPPSTSLQLRKSVAKRADPTQPEQASGVPEEFPFTHLEIRPSGQWKKETATTKNPVNQPGFPRLGQRQSML
jgi:hypothetical protein